MPTSEPPLSDPARALNAELRKLYLRAGEPSMRTIASSCGPGVISHNTVHKVLGAPHASALRHLMIIVDYLQGDCEAFREMWIAAKLVDEDAPAPPAAQAAALQVAASPQGDTAEQRLTLADELFLISHFPRDGRATVNRKSLGIALAGAVFAELIEAGQVRQHGRRLLPVEQDSTCDAVWAFFLDRVRALDGEHVLDLQQWVRFLKDDAVRLVGQRLADAGLVVPEQVRRFSRRSGDVRYPQTASPRARAPMVRLRGHLLADSANADPQTAMLAALVEVVGAHKGIPLDFGEAQLREKLRALSGRLPADMREIIHAVDLSIAKSAITPDI